MEQQPKQQDPQNKPPSIVDPQKLPSSRAQNQSSRNEGQSSLQQSSSSKGGTSGSSTDQTPTSTSSTGPRLFISEKTELHGQITFGENCILHPACTIIAEGGDIHIGEFNIIEEKVRIINRVKKDENGKPIKRDMYIGSYNVFEVHSQIDSTDIGDMNEFQHRSVVVESKIENCCQINACVTVPSGTHLESQSVVYEDGKIKKNNEPNEEAKKVSIKELCTFLAEQLPKHNKERKR